MTIPDPCDGPVRRKTVPAIHIGSAGQYWPAAAIVLLAMIVRSVVWLNCDVSWLLTLGERVLAGARAYVDFSEPNPPASILIFMPAILIGRAIGVVPELMVTVLTFLGVVVSLGMSGLILRGYELVDARGAPLLLALTCALLLILPGDAFAQREHIALLAIMPMLAVYAQRARGVAPANVLAGLAGIGGGIAVAIKPYFALALIFPLASAVWNGRSRWTRMFAHLPSPEHLWAALVLFAYGCLVIWQFSDYVRVMLPIVLSIYAPPRTWVFLKFGGISVLLIAMSTVVSVAVDARQFRDPLIRIASLAALGFTCALVLQGKGWQYHAYPAMALSMFVLSVVLVRSLYKISALLEFANPLSRDTLFGVALFVGIYGIESFWLLPDPSRARLVVEVSRLAPVHPKVISIHGGPDIAFPLTRKLEGTPVGRAPFQWISASADRLLASRRLADSTRRTIDAYAYLDRKELAETIRTQRPDVVLVGFGEDESWAFAHPEIADALRPYHNEETVDGVEVWLLRKSLTAGTH